MSQKKQSQWAGRRHRERDDQAFALGNDLHYYEVFSGTLHGSDGISKFVEDRETGLLEELGAEPKKGIRSYKDIALTSVMSKWSCISLRLDKGKGPRTGIICTLGG